MLKVKNKQITGKRMRTRLPAFFKNVTYLSDPWGKMPKDTLTAGTGDLRGAGWLSQGRDLKSDSFFPAVFAELTRLFMLPWDIFAERRD